MSRSLYLALAAGLSLATSNPAHSQDAPNNNPPASPATSTAPTSDDVATLQAENAALKKENVDAAKTIAQLQAQLAQAGINHQAPTTGAPTDVTDTSAAAAPTSPQKALPLDDTNAVVNAAAPGATDARPSKTYTVVKGDSLWKIAHKMYPGDTKNGVDKLQEANKDAIGGKPLKIGQILVVPQ
jgi:nucleoid-associated protein YgaU